MDEFAERWMRAKLRSEAPQEQRPKRGPLARLEFRPDGRVNVVASPGAARDEVSAALRAAKAVDPLTDVEVGLYAFALDRRERGQEWSDIGSEWDRAAPRGEGYGARGGKQLPRDVARIEKKLSARPAAIERVIRELQTSVRRPRRWRPLPLRLGLGLPRRIA